MLENPKILLSLIAITIISSGVLGFQLMDWTLLNGVALNSPRAHTGSLLDKFSSAEGEQVTDSDEISARHTASTLISISESTAISPSIGSRDGAVLFYDRLSGTLREFYAPDNSMKTVEGSKVSGLIKVVWSPDRLSAINILTGKTGPELKYFHYPSKRTSSLPINIRSLAYSPDSSQIVYFVSTGDLGGVYVSQPDGSSPKKILETRIAEMSLFWPSQDDIYFLTKNISSGAWDLVRINQAGGLDNIITDRYNVEVTWSRDGSHALISSADQTGAIEFGYLNFLGSVSGAYTTLPIRASASSCTWNIANTAVYCGVSSQDPSTGDAVYRLEVGDTEPSLIYAGGPSSAKLHIQEPFLSPLESHLFFINKIDGRLYGLKLR